MKAKRPHDPWQLLATAGLGSEAPQGASKSDPSTGGSLAPLPGDVKDVITDADSYVGKLIRARPGQQVKAQRTFETISTDTTQPPPEGWQMPKKRGAF